MKIKVEEIKRITENLLGFITVYVMRVKRNETTPAYRIYRRYHEIHGLHEHLKQIFHTSFTGVRFPPFPTRKLLFPSDRSARRKAKDLSSYFDGLLEIPFVATSSTLDEFILKIPKDYKELISKEYVALREPARTQKANGSLPPFLLLWKNKKL